MINGLGSSTRRWIAIAYFLGFSSVADAFSGASGNSLTSQQHRLNRRCNGLQTTIPIENQQYTRLNALIPLETGELSQLIAVGPPTAAQYSTYWGRTNQERFGRGVESATVSILGLCFSYFMSFVLGGFVATIFGALFLFWGVLSPELKAYQRNWEFLGGRGLVDRESLDPDIDPDRAGLYGALLLGCVSDVCVVESTKGDSYEYDLEEFKDYDANSDEQERFTGQPYLLRVLVADTTGRELQVHARMMEDYVSVQRGMPAVGIMMATTPRFDRLAAITDLYVPEAGCYIGDYPYLDRAEVEELLATDDDVWETLLEEGHPDIPHEDNNLFTDEDSQNPLINDEDRESRIER